MWVLFTLMLLLSPAGDPPHGPQHERSANLSEWQAWHDALTRLLNRGALFEQAMAVASDCQRSGRPLAVIQLDLDHFKHINDRYGHQAGTGAVDGGQYAVQRGSAGRSAGQSGRRRVLYRDAEYHPCRKQRRWRSDCASVSRREVSLHNNDAAVSASLGERQRRAGSISLKRCSRWPMGDSIWPSKWA